MESVGCQQKIGGRSSGWSAGGAIVLAYLLGVIPCSRANAGCIDAEAADAASAKANKTEAERLFKAGTDLLDAHENPKRALELLQRAYQCDPTGMALLNIATALFRLQRFVEAAEIYERCLNDANVADEDKRTAGHNLTELDKTLCRLTVEVDPAASVTVDDQVIERRPVRLRLLEGKHTVRSTNGSAEKKQDLLLQAGSNVAIDLRLPIAATSPAPLPPPPPTPPPAPRDTIIVVSESHVHEESRWYQRWWFWAGLGAVAVAIAGGAWLASRQKPDDCQGVNPCGQLR